MRRPKQAPRSPMHSSVDLRVPESVWVFVPAQQFWYPACKHDSTHQRRSRDRLKQIDLVEIGRPWRNNDQRGGEQRERGGADERQTGKPGVGVPETETGEVFPQPETSCDEQHEEPEQARSNGHDDHQERTGYQGQGQQQFHCSKSPTQPGPDPPENPEVVHRHGGQSGATQLGESTPRENYGENPDGDSVTCWPGHEIEDLRQESDG